jgi:hypothetical protein
MHHRQGDRSIRWLELEIAHRVARKHSAIEISFQIIRSEPQPERITDPWSEIEFLGPGVEAFISVS